MTYLPCCKEGPDPGAGLPGGGDMVMHANLRLGDTTLMASGGFGQGQPVFQGFSLTLTVTDQAEVSRRFAILAEGGHVLMPLAKTLWSPLFRMVPDGFGGSWMINVMT